MHVRRLVCRILSLVLFAALLVIVTNGLKGADTAASPSVFRQPPNATGPLSGAEKERQRELVSILDSSNGNPSAGLLREHGFVKVSEAASGDLRLAASNSDDVTMYTPSVYFDTTYYRYTATARYKWNCVCWEGQGGDVGGPDGFALRFDRLMDNRGVTGTFFGMPGKPFGATVKRNPADNSSFGVAYKHQDYAGFFCCGTADDYTMYSGTVTMTVGRPRCGTTTSLYSRYWHTWDDSSVNGFSIGRDGFGISWTDTGKEWSAASQAGKWRVTC